MSGHGDEPYVRYLHAFFARWSPLYDIFAAPIGFVYRAAARATGIGPGRTLVDVCTGTGELAFRAARSGGDVLGIDFTPSMLRRARRKARGRPIRFVDADARRLPLADGSVDAAILSFALHDMPRRVRVEALVEAVRVSREGVVVLDYEPAARGPARRLALAVLELFETAYLSGFARDGGIAGAVADAGLVLEPIARPVRGLFALYRVRRAAPPA